jgi:hypothetical protein
MVGDTHFLEALDFLSKRYDLPRATVIRRMVKQKAAYLGFRSSAEGDEQQFDLRPSRAAEKLSEKEAAHAG